MLSFAMMGSMLLLACGQTEHDGGTPPVGGAAPAGGVSSAGSDVVGAGSAGVAGAAVAGPPAMDISGRWAMFDFEDPVGVGLYESATGVLTGQGCAVGAPGAGQPGSDSFSANAPYLCGGISGSVTGNKASFGFGFSVPSALYATTVTISNDAQRMSGVFGTGMGTEGFLVSWLRVPPGQTWIQRLWNPSAQGDALEGHYELVLRSADAGGETAGEYVADKTYALAYSLGAIRGDLGSFWSTEASDPLAGSPLRVGPVPATVPELPVEMRLEFDAQGFTQAAVTTASGHAYLFTVARAPTP